MITIARCKETFYLSRAPCAIQVSFASRQPLYTRHVISLPCKLQLFSSAPLVSPCPARCARTIPADPPPERPLPPHDSPSDWIPWTGRITGLTMCRKWETLLIRRGLVIVGMRVSSGAARTLAQAPRGKSQVHGSGTLGVGVERHPICNHGIRILRRGWPCHFLSASVECADLAFMAHTCLCGTGAEDFCMEGQKSRGYRPIRLGAAHHRVIV